MSQNLFFSSVPFTLCELKPVEGSEPTTYELVDTETITLRNLTLEGEGYLKSYIRQTYLNTQLDAIAGRSVDEQNQYIKLISPHIFKLTIGTEEGNEILFQSAEGMIHYTWVFVRNHVKEGIKIFDNIHVWKNALQSSGVAYQENMNRFNKAIIELAVLTQKELEPYTEKPQELDTEWVDDLMARLMCEGFSMDDVKAMTLEQALFILKTKYPDKQNQAPVFQTDDPKAFNDVLKHALENKE